MKGRQGTTAKNYDFVTHATFQPDESAFFSLIGEPLDNKTPGISAGYFGGSLDFSHIIVYVPKAQEANLIKEAIGTDTTLYELDPPHLRLVGVNNKGKVLSPACEPYLGAQSAKDSGLNAVSADGSGVFFTVGTAGATRDECLEHAQLFVREGGTRTLEVSRPLGGCVSEPGGISGEVPCAGALTRASAEFVGASESGNRVYFISQAPLTPGQTDETVNLYMAEIGCRVQPCAPAQREVTRLVRVSAGAQAAEVVGSLDVAQDGSRVLSRAWHFERRTELRRRTRGKRRRQSLRVRRAHRPDQLRRGSLFWTGRIRSRSRCEMPGHPGKR